MRHHETAEKRRPSQSTVPAGTLAGDYGSCQKPWATRKPHHIFKVKKRQSVAPEFKETCSSRVT